MADYYFECDYTSKPKATAARPQCVVNPYYGKGKTAPRKKRARTH